MSTKIEWTDETWNPVTGCTKVSQGCKNCYAERLAPKVFAGQKIPLGPWPEAGFRPRVFTDVLCHPERLDAPLHWKKPRRVFVNSMSDLFHEDVPDEFIDRVFAVMALSQGDLGWFRFGRDYAAEGDPPNGRHTFQILTKRPGRMLEYIKHADIGRIIDISNEFVMFQDFDYAWTWPLPNVWLGVSVEDQDTADERIQLLLQTPAAVRFVSYEPALAAIDFARSCAAYRFIDRDGAVCCGMLRNLDWLIAGSESGPKARLADVAWYRSVRDQCAATGVAFFMKQITERGRKVPFEAWPADLQIREYPHGQTV